jgi:S1-C subfamily serine protease
MRGSASKIICVGLALIGLSASALSSARADYAASEAWFNSKTEEDRVTLQGMLILVGQYTGLVDETFGRLTFEAVVGYQASKGWATDGVLTAPEQASLQAEATAAFVGYGFNEQTDPPTSLKLPVPEKVLTSHRNTRLGSLWESIDGGIALETLRVPEEQTSFDKLFHRMSTGRNRSVEYSILRDSMFVVSGQLGEREFYVQVFKFPGESRGFSMSFDHPHKQAGALIATFLASSMFANLKPPKGPSTSPPTVTTPSASSAGSGFAISPDGTIVTNAHVVDHCTNIGVTGFGPGKLITADAEQDLAVIQLAGGSFPTAAKIKSRKPELGEAIVVIGYPLSNEMGNALTVSPGVVASISGLGGDPRSFSVSANLQPGNSGGPILDMHGAVVGVAQAKLNEIEMLKHEGTTGGTVGFAIDTPTLLDFLRPFKTETFDNAGESEFSVQDVVSKAKSYTVQIVCHR